MQKKYEIIGVVGEGAYGIVIKCRNKEKGEYVAIKKFKETEDEIVKKTMKRELKMLQLLRHPNVVEFKEAFNYKRNLYLVFEYVERNLLEVLQEKPAGLDHKLIKSFIYQLCLSIKYLHDQNIIHRDIKPENLLINNNMQLKLCDFGFARKVSLKFNETLTDYVATRWYRSPELLITSGYYGPEVDYWAIGCIMGELADGIALFPGDNETDQLHCIQKVLGNLPEDQIDKFYKNPIYNGKCLLNVTKAETLEKRYLGKLPKAGIKFLKDLLALDPSKRLNSSTVFNHPYFENYGDNYIDKNTRKSATHEGNRLPLNNLIVNTKYSILKEKEGDKDNSINNNSINDNNKKSINKNEDEVIKNNQTSINNTNLNIINYNFYNNNDKCSNTKSIVNNIINNDISNVEDKSILKPKSIEVKEQKYQEMSQIVPSQQVYPQSNLYYAKIPMELTMGKFPKKSNLNKLYNNSIPISNLPIMSQSKVLNPKQKFTITNNSFNLKQDNDFTSSSTIITKDNILKNKNAVSIPPSDFLMGYKTFYTKKDPYNFNLNTQFKKYNAPPQQLQKYNTSRFQNAVIEEESEYLKEEKKQKSKSLNPIKKPNYNWQKLSMYQDSTKKKQVNYANSSCYGSNFTRGLNFHLPSLGKVYKGNNENYKKYKY